jgi:hypothetical protein
MAVVHVAASTGWAEYPGGELEVDPLHRTTQHGT